MKQIKIDFFSVTAPGTNDQTQSLNRKKLN